MNTNSAACQCLRDFMIAQKEVISRHLDEHKYLRQMENRQEALESFIENYGWIFREIYCTKVCSSRSECEISHNLSITGDLLRDRIK